MNRHSEQTQAFKADILEILLALSEAPVHGYGIVQAVHERTGGRMSLAPSLLYRRLHRLAEDGLVEQAGVEAGRRGKDKRLYRLTAAGREVLRAEATRLVELANSPGVLRAVAPRAAESG